MSSIIETQKARHRLQTEHKLLIIEWKTASIQFDANTFSIATELLEHNLLPEKAQTAYAQQIRQAIAESLSIQNSLSAFFQTPCGQEDMTPRKSPLAEQVKSLIDTGMEKNQAIQKIAQQNKTTAFIVSKQYRKQFDF